MKRYYYLLSFTIPVCVLLSLVLRGNWSYLAVVFAFVLLPLLEIFLPGINLNLSPEGEERWKKDKYFDALLWLMVPIQWGLLIYFCQILSSVSLSVGEQIGLISAMGIACGVLGINVAHELGHRNNKGEQALAKLLLSTSLYWHFFIEHNRGHHKHVSTPLDPESSRLNEPLYFFWYRSIKDSFLSAYKIDKRQVITAVLTQALLPLAIYFIWGERALYGFLASAFTGILLLETVNYIEHYGLVRKEMAPNRYEKVQVHHSWNANNPFSRTILFDLSRHSDHHANINRKYQLLRHHDESPQLPTGYPGMLLLALVPPLWFRVMNKKIRQQNEAS